MRAFVIVLSSLFVTIPASAQLLVDDNHLLQQGLDGAPGERESDDFFGNEAAGGDFNGDGYADLAVASPGESNSRGLVTVFLGGAIGLVGEGAKEYIQGEGGLDGNDESGDGFGTSLAAGDFDNDGYWDVAVGVPGEAGTRGIVQVLYGSENGLTGDRDQVFDQDDLEGSGPGPGDFFGNVVVVGDFNADGFADLAVGSPGEAQGAGVIHAIYGSTSGLTTNGNQRWRQDADDIEGNREPNDLFGLELAAGDFNGDGADELAIGVPGEDGGEGGVAVIFGSRGGGLQPAGNLFLAQGENGIPDRREGSDAFGTVLAAGDFNGDGFDELVAASINEDNGRGVVIVLPGSPSGPTGASSTDWRQGQRDLQDQQESGDRFGTSLATGDFDADGFEDLAVGVRGEDDNRGIVQVIYGSASGLTAGVDDQLFQEGLEGLVGEARPGDDFGTALAVGNFGFDAAHDLVVGAPREESNEDRGSVYVIYGDGLDVVSSGLSLPRVFEGSYNAILKAIAPNFLPADLAGSGGLVNGRVGTIAAGVCIEMDGQRAPVFEVRSGQVNFQALVAPDQRRSVVTVIANCGAANERRSLPVALTIAPAAPEFFFFATGQAGPVAAIDSLTGAYLGAPGMLPGATFRRARAGDLVTVFVTGLGDTAPRFATGELPAQSGRAVAQVTIELGGRQIQPSYAGVTGGFAGLYQVNFQVEAGVGSGDLPIKMIVQTAAGPVETSPGAFLSVE